MSFYESTLRIHFTRLAQWFSRKLIATRLAITLLVAIGGIAAGEACATAVVVFLVDQPPGVAIEADVTAVVAPGGLLGSHHHASHHFARLDVTAGNRLLDAGDNHIAQTRIATARAAQHLDAHAL